MATIALLLSGLGLFFIGVRGLSANLVPLVGRQARIGFSRTLRGPVGCAVSGVIAGIITQSATAVGWIIVSFVRSGTLTNGHALLAPTWANVGTALLPLIVALDTTTPAGIVIGIVGLIIYFRPARSDRMRNALEAVLGAALLLFGMHLVSLAIGPLRDNLMHSHWWDLALESPLLLGLIGAAFSFAAQSSAVAAALAVGAVAGGLLDLPAALPLVAGANAAGALNYALLMPGESTTGRIVFMLQITQKIVGALLLTVLALIGVVHPAEIANLMAFSGDDTAAQLAVVFLLAQIVGALVTHLLNGSIRHGLLRLLRTGTAQALDQPSFLLQEALRDPTTALDLAMRELARLGSRLPLMLDHVRNSGEPHTPAPARLRAAGVTLSTTVKDYLASLLDGQLTRPQVATALLLDDAAGNLSALHDALAEFAEAATHTAGVPTADRLIEGLHVLLGAVAEHGESLGADDPALVLSLLGHRDPFMEELRLRLSSQAEISLEAQQALFHMTVLFERIVWMARRLVNDINQTHRVLSRE